MAAKIIQDLRNLSVQELDEKLSGLRQKLMEHKLQAGLGRLEKHSQIKNARRDIARILTVKKELQVKK